ncbi:CRISPR system Cascade subunit CasB [Actinokineospora terrae]|uniref:CRISPR system Cascade subunit CasB n=2 Tax=Actinokineospora terrae TaxID=155974 RepID=A0A1H9MAN0_9PSEU|nr:CRISPR system Cascade subunit CasB [Actinokineospora terrae]
MPDPGRRGKWYWEKYIDDEGRWVEANKSPSGQHLAAMRRGLGKPPGSVPQMWPLYEAVVSHEGSPRLAAEHAALCLFGLHQQSQRTPMHTPGVGLGAALRRLSRLDNVSEEAVTRRFNAAATATSFDELVEHLRRLVTQLRSKAIPLDYTRLHRDLLAWSTPDGQARARRRWGMQYHAWHATTVDTPAT